ncbi:DNA repair protein XRCC4-like [Anguilla anguilla]|uniref:DNA repair protein XRCC4-like n=1 Tax=Anguilla anguilla TaxID=7936 RepID=UPI0015AA62D6|nr:DNA repair protein XRCC4-like [Anguilla anguilla]
MSAKLISRDKTAELPSGFRMSVSVRGISVSNRPGHSFFLKVAWREQLGRGFTVTLSDGVSAWDGKVSASDVIRESEEMEIQMEKYVQDLQLALTEEGQQAKGYTFHLSPDSAQSGVLHLSYEKAQKDISFRLGSVELQPVAEPCEVIKALISHGLERSGQLQASSLHLREENQRLREEQDHMTADDRPPTPPEGVKGPVRQPGARPRTLFTAFAMATVCTVSADSLPAPHQLDPVLRINDDIITRFPTQKWSYLTQGSGPELPSHSPIEESLTDIDVAPSRKRRQRHLQGPGSEVKKGVQEVQKKESTEPARSKAEANRKASRRSAAIATTSKPTETDDLFDDF